MALVLPFTETCTAEMLDRANAVSWTVSLGIGHEQGRPESDVAGLLSRFRRSVARA